MINYYEIETFTNETKYEEALHDINEFMIMDGFESKAVSTSKYTGVVTVVYF
ncbi:MULTISPECIES: hypothetical protein [Lysinibacillus]|uniref:hypothetical protein n=1 Tax=Lysinibacillus TaxID=400634 RepID=UPI00214C1391|nr:MULTISPECIES: hypothetical protein [Lysinibacillus]UUV25886.1 hypothetical protein NP781_04520 [Lysinibacillus sp. FN11]UYB48759.1 hypothetical protein OCI51_07310 [Lysinibacillus capsici]